MPHIHKNIDFTVEVFIVFANTVLLRKHDKYGIWLSVGGHIELNEDPNQAAIREVKEEVGLNIRLVDDLLPFERATPEYKELIPPKFLNRHRINDIHEHVTLTYFATTDNHAIQVGLDEKSSELKWFTKEEIESNTEILDRIKVYALRALAEVRSSK